MKKREKFRTDRDIVFMPALAPLEASVIPAKERRSVGALRHARASFRLPGEPEPQKPRVSGRRSGSNR